MNDLLKGLLFAKMVYYYYYYYYSVSVPRRIRVPRAQILTQTDLQQRSKRNITIIFTFKAKAPRDVLIKRIPKA